MIENWNPDDADIPKQHYNSICRFNFGTEHDKALRYRNKEIPFILYNVSSLDRVTDKWTEEYLHKTLNNHKFGTERSTNNHFMYYRNTKHAHKPKDWKPPTERITMTYGDWLKEAKKAINKAADTVHYYLRISSGDHKIIKDVTYFNKNRRDSNHIQDMLLVKPEHQR